MDSNNDHSSGRELYVKTIKGKRYSRAVPDWDFLKFWKPIRMYVLRKYNIKTADLDMLLFLYSEMYFKKTDFDEFNNLLSWDVQRFERLQREGWISVWRKRKLFTNERTIYEISMKGRNMITRMYGWLRGEYMSEDKQGSVMFSHNATYSDKVHRNFIRKLNRERRGQK